MRDHSVILDIFCDPVEEILIPTQRSSAAYTMMQETAHPGLDVLVRCVKGMDNMKLKRIDYDLTVCKVASIADVDTAADFFFLGKTDEELSLVCRTEDTPEKTIERDDGWRGFRIQGVLDFSLIGILAKISRILADHRIGIFAMSTYNTDYILVKEENFERALDILGAKGYEITE